MSAFTQKFLTFIKSEESLKEEFQHLRCCFGNVSSSLLTILPKNASNYAAGVSLQGVFYEMMEWMGQSNSKQMTYEFIPLTATTAEDTNSSFGAIHYLESHECDVVTGSILLRQDRYRRIDFLHPFIFDPAGLAIPIPISSTSISAIWKPFQFNVWVLIFIAIFVAVAAMSLLDRYSQNTANTFINSRLYLHFRFVFGILVSQSSRSTAGNKLILRFVAGAWCFLSLVMVISYSSTLTSFIMAPHYEPLVNSLEELVEKLDYIKPVVRKGFGMDVTISKSNDALLKKVAMKINTSPTSRCQTTKDCLDEVKKGSAVFIHTRGTALDWMEKDFRQTGRCNFALARETFGVYPSSWGIAKHHPYLEVLNRGVLWMMETGLITKWTNDDMPQLKQCLGRNALENNKFKHKSQRRISLDNMKGSFVILVTGIIISALIFAVEICYYGCIFTSSIFLKCVSI